MIEFRTAGPEDAAAVARLHARSWREHYRGEFDDAYLDGDLEGERLGVWRERLDPPPTGQHVLLAEDDEGLAGFVCVQGDQDPTWGSFVDNLHVATRAKRRGVGSTLMRRSGAWLAQHHPGLGVHLLVLASNAAARSFYERLDGACAETSRMETHGGARVESCRYVWRRAGELARGGVRQRPLAREEIGRLWSIDRSESIRGLYRLEGGRLRLRAERHELRGWPAGEPEKYTPILEACHARGGWCRGLFDGGRLIGAAVLDARFRPGAGRRLQLAFLHVSQAERRLGWGRELFEGACAEAQRRGAGSLYVSATPSEGTVGFYRSLGCRVAAQPDPELHALEPEDIHLERPLG